MATMDDGRLKGKVAIVTGSGRGIGRGIALRFGKEGAVVVVATRTLERGEAVAEEIRTAGGTAVAAACDVTDKLQVQDIAARTIAEYGTVHILVNNAMAWQGGGDSNVRLSVDQIPDEWWQEAMETALYGAIYFSNAVFPAMKEQAYGKIINVSSGGGVFGIPGGGAYNTAKEALRGYSKTAAQEWAKHGIRVNIICPLIETDAYRESRRNNPDGPVASASIPLGYLGDAERDAGGLAFYLASPDSDYMTGNTIFLEGGWHFLP